MAATSCITTSFLRRSHGVGAAEQVFQPGEPPITVFTLQAREPPDHAGREQRRFRSVIRVEAALGEVWPAAAVMRGDQVHGEIEYILRNCHVELVRELAERSELVAIIAGDLRDYKDAHPTTAILIVEVAEALLAYDRTEKASLYAKAGIQDYWVLNLINRRLEVRRTPIVDPTQPFGSGYASLTILTETDFVTPLAMPQAKIAVADLLP